MTNDLFCSSGFSEHEKFSLFQAKQRRAGTIAQVDTLYASPLPVSPLRSHHGKRLVPIKSNKPAINCGLALQVARTDGRGRERDTRGCAPALRVRSA